MKYQKIEEYINIVKFNLTNHTEIDNKMTRNFNFFNNLVKKLNKHFSELELEDNSEINEIISTIEVIENKINKEIIKSNTEYKKYKEKIEKEENNESTLQEISNVGFSDISILANKTHLKKLKHSSGYGYYD